MSDMDNYNDNPGMHNPEPNDQQNQAPQEQQSQEPQEQHSRGQQAPEAQIQEPRQPGLPAADDELFRKRQARRKRKRSLHAAIRLSVAAVICIPLIFFCFWSGTKLFFPADTVITGIKPKVAQIASKGLTKTVTVEHPENRDLELQRFDEETGNWHTEQTVSTGFDDVEKVKLDFPEVWTKFTHSRWRLRMDRAFGVKGYVGEPFDVTCRNREKLDLKCESAVIYCKDDDEVLYDRKMNKKLPNASTTKMMTAILALENCKDDEVVTFSHRAVITPYAYYGIHTGYKFRLGALMRAMLIQSANECATAVGEHVGGTYEKFRDMMNKRAKELGCKRTHFMTPSGLDVSGHYSTAYDIALINSRAVDFPEYNKIMLMENYKLKNLNKNDPWHYDVKTTNYLLRDQIKGYMGGKTGTTGMAGNCLSSAYKWKDKIYILVVFDADDRFASTKKLMKYVRKYAD